MKNQIKNTFLVQDIAVLAGIIAIGVVLTLLGGWWSILGIFIILCAVVMIPLYRNGYKLAGHKGVFHQKELTLSREDKEQILAYLDGSQKDIDLKSKPAGGGALVDVFYRKSDGYMLARYFDYADYVNGIDYPLQEVTPEQVSKLEAFAGE